MVDQLHPGRVGQAVAVRGESCWPHAGRSRGRTRGALLAAYGDSLVAAVTDEVVQVFEPELTQLQLQVLELLHVPPGAYRSNRSAWQHDGGG